MQTGAPVLASGRLSARDEKEPQIVLNTLRPITDAEPPADAPPTLFIKLPGEESPEYERLKLVHTMFPGREKMVIHFSDTRKTVGARCVIHEAFVSELREMLGAENVVVK